MTARSSVGCRSPASSWSPRGRDLLKLAAADPFPDSPEGSDLRRFVSVLAKRPRKPPALPWSYPAGDRWRVKLVAVSGRFVLCHWRRLGRAVLEPNGVVEEQYGVSATTRNWNTILRIRDVVQGTGGKGASSPHG